MSEVRVHDVVVAGVKSLVRESGPPTASEAVVFVHGNPGSSEDFADLLPRVGEFARAVAPDMPGFGKAARPRDFAYTIDGYAAHLARMLRELGISRVHFVLHDFGGPWGMALAAESGAGLTVASFTLINIGVMPGYRWHRIARLWRTPVIGEILQAIPTRGSFRFALNAENPKPFPDAFVNRMYDDADWPMKRAVLALYRSVDDLGGAMQRMGDALRARRLPALVVWGEADPYAPSRFAETQKEYFDADVHVLAGCGHWPMIDEPERVRDLILPFLRRQLGAG